MGSFGMSTEMKESQFFERTVTVKVWTILLLAAVLSLLCYLAWEAYWISQIGLMAVKWHTRLVFTGLVSLLLLSPLWLAAAFARPPRQANVLLSGLSAVAGLVFLEAAMGAIGVNSTYMERKSGYYHSQYGMATDRPYWVAEPGSSRDMVSPGEFSYPRTYNNLGHSGPDWPLEKDSGTLRIIALGDSFTEGDGAPADSSYPAQLQDILRSRGVKAEVLNAGMCGSDPIYNLRDLKDRLHVFKPDMVLLAITDNDLYFDILNRGGMERFLPDGSVRSPHPPWWEPIYAMSHVSRSVFHALGLNMDNPSARYSPEELDALFSKVLDEMTDHFVSLAREHGFQPVIFTFPLGMGDSYQGRDVFAGVRQSEEMVFIDLGHCYQQRAIGIRTPLYWPKDGHHNSRGYRMMADCMSMALMESAILAK